MNIYLAGPMRGIPDFNFPAFHKAAAELRAKGHTVFNPAERDEAEFGNITCPSGDENDFAKLVGFQSGLSVARNCFLADTQWICQFADAIAIIPGWETSRGAKAEKALGEAIGLEIIYL